MEFEILKGELDATSDLMVRFNNDLVCLDLMQDEDIIQVSMEQIEQLHQILTQRLLINKSIHE